MKNLKLFLLGLMLCAALPSQAWDRTRHDAIAYIAECNLTPRAKRNIARYLDHSIVYYASWMDKYRDTPEFRNVEHVSYVDADMQLVDTLRKGKTNCVVELMRAVDRLKDYRNMSDSLVRLNLMYVIHIVGDMHCPAHIKYATHDMKYDVLFEDKYRKAHKFYVHSVWDNEIITVSRIWSVSEWADELDRLPKSDKQAIAAGTPRDWLHDAAVCCEVQFEWAKPDARLGQDFLNKALPLVESQIRKAGYRLARLLNGLFD